MSTPCIENKAYWRKHIEAFQVSELNAKAYCEQSGVHYRRFIYQKNKSRDVSDKRPLIPVTVATSVVNRKICSIHFCSGHQLLIHDIQVLPVILEALL